MTKNTVSTFALSAVLLAGACSQKPAETNEPLITPMQSPYQLLFLKNSNGVKMQVTTLGARVMNLWVPDSNGTLVDVVLGFDTPEEYLVSSEPFFGTAIGRYGNRIAKGKFELDGKTYSLPINNGQNTLHGGPGGFHNVNWTVVESDDSHIVFYYESKDGEEGFPGNLSVKMTYFLTEENEFKITYEAETDQATPVNLTHHSFFNLNGEGVSDVLDHELQLVASKYTPVDSTLIPFGTNDPVADTPMDFTKVKPIGKDISQTTEQLAFGGGFDHNWVLDKKKAGELELAATVFAPQTGIGMEVWTTEPGIQFYSGNFLDGSIKGKGGKQYNFRAAFCLETQHFPDSPNQPAFPSTILKPGEKYSQTCIYKFIVK
jgi:aldose 1-epimerase